jgi:serine/threonine-protein kinase
MTERLQQIELLYHAALEHDESTWPTFLDSACAGDEDLRREVESLLSYSKLSENFIETPALAIIAKELASKQRQELARCRDDARRKKKQ